MVPNQSRSDKSSREQELIEETQAFLHCAVHDLKAAQRSNGVAIELLQQTTDQKERDGLTQQILRGLLKTQELLNGIGKYANSLSPDRFSSNIFPSASAVRFALANLEREIREAGAAITVEDLPEIKGDREGLVEVFEQLIRNSLTFRGTEVPAVAISASRVSGGWLFSVKDNGIGIPLKYRERLFIAFRRLQGSDTPGVGLGLVICKKIIEAHKGRIWIDSDDSPGATICFTLSDADGD